MFFGDGTQRHQVAQARVCEDDVDASLVLGDSCIDAIEVRKLGDVCLDCRDICADGSNRGIRLGFAAASDINIRAFSHELLRRGRQCRRCRR